MRNIKYSLVVSLLIISQSLFASEDESKRIQKENDMLKAYFNCTQRIMDKDSFFGSDVRLALNCCRHEYYDAQMQVINDRDFAWMHRMFEKNEKEIEEMEQIRKDSDKH